MIVSAEQAFQKLQNSHYAIQKAFISRCFKMPYENFKDIIQLRLQLIDSLYSTQMNKRHFGIEELAEALSVFTDIQIKNEIEKQTKGEFSETLESLFTSKYGYDKNGLKNKKAVSLLSKYFYFLTNYQYPIYDSLVRIAYRKINDENNLKLKYPSVTDTNFFEALSELNQKSGINNYEKLDNLLWYTEKLKSESFSLILSKDEFLNRLK